MSKIQTNGVRYIGSKNKVIPKILEVINDLDIKNKTFIDVFTGTTRVAQAFKSDGWKVLTSDLSWASEAYANNFICSVDNSHLQQHIDHLNTLDGYAGWLTNNYCDATGTGDSIVRVWKRKNGMKADAMRDCIEALDIPRKDKMCLITSLIFSLDRIDNTVGIQQAYLKHWASKRSDKDLVLSLLPNVEGTKGKHIVGDALKISYPNYEVAYLDPPYTSADYSTYYHIWDSIVAWDKPKVSLKTNRRVDRVKSGELHDKNMKSPWYSKKTALKATKELIDRLPVRYCVFSYSDEGLIPREDMEKLCMAYKNVQWHQKEHDRHVMSRIGHGGNEAKNAGKKKLSEWIIVIEKETK
jgi:adenine-specific DNA-methyltransferase